MQDFINVQPKAKQESPVKGLLACAAMAPVIGAAVYYGLQLIQYVAITY